MIEFAHLIGTLHFRLIAMFRLVLERNKLYDVNPTQAFMMMAIGEGKLKFIDLESRGFNHYCINGMVEKGYVTWASNEHDKRSVFYQLTDKGSRVVKLFQHLFRDQAMQIYKTAISNEEFAELIPVLDRLDRFYLDLMR